MFIYITFISSATVIPATTTKLSNCQKKFLTVSLICQHFKKKIWKNTYSLAFNLEKQLCFRDSKLTLFHRNINLPPRKFSFWHWCCINQCNVSDVSGKFSEIGTGTKKGQLGLIFRHKYIKELGIYFKQEMQSNILLWQVVCNRLLQIFPSIYLKMYISRLVLVVGYEKK